MPTPLRAQTPPSGLRRGALLLLLALVLASPLAPAPTTAPAADIIALDSLLDALDAGAPTTGVIVTLHPTAEALALAARAASALQAAAWATTSTECARHGPRLATRKEVAGESRRLMPV